MAPVTRLCGPGPSLMVVQLGAVVSLCTYLETLPRASGLTGMLCSVSQVFEILLSRGYSENNFRDDLKNLYLKLGIENKMMIFLFTDAHVAEEGFLELVNNMLTSGTRTLVSHGVCWSLRLSFQRRLSDKHYLLSALPTYTGGIIQALTAG